MTITKQQFLNQCTDFENIVRHKYKLKDTDSPYYTIAHIDEFREYVDDINVIRILRNTFVHNNTTINGEEAFEIKPIISKSLDEIMAKLTHPPRVSEIYTPQVISAQEHDLVWETMEKMKEKGINHIPVLKNGKVIGVFSESTVFSALLDHKTLRKEETMQDLFQFLPFEAHRNADYGFISISDTIQHAKEAFMKIRSKPLSVLFVTQNGKPEEKLLGLITPYDFLKDRNTDRK